MRFSSLHHHSTYSFLDGYALPEAHVRRASELGMGSLALTEHGNVFSHAKFEQAAVKEGIQPIFGCEFYCGPIDEENRNQSKNHLTVLAKTQEGYRNLLRLVTEANDEGFYHQPTVSGRMLTEKKEGLIVLSGCQSSLLFTSLMGGKRIQHGAASYGRALGVARRFARTFGDSYYIEVQAFPELRETCQANEAFARMSRETGIPLVVTLDCHYTMPTEKELQQVLHNVRPGKQQTLEEQIRGWGYNADLCVAPNDNTILRKLIATGVPRSMAVDAILATEEIAQRCKVELPKLPMIRYPTKDSRATWRAWLKQGWRERGCHKLPRAERERYSERLRYEMGIIEEKDFVDYFLVVSDSLRWAKDAGIAVGPARGSAAASLACWLLRITEVNPLLFDHLVFERFIDISRQDLPDIDVDFEAGRRHEVVDYLIARYGRDCVSDVGTFTMYKSKLALDDTARVFRIPQYEVEKVKDVLIERSSGDLRSSATIEDTFEQFDQAGKVLEEYPRLATATRLEGNAKGFGVHAAGVVVSNGPITDVCSVITRVVKGRVRKVVGIDKYDSEYLGLLKLDYLRLNAMDRLAGCCRDIGEPASYLYSIDTEDQDVVQLFHENDVTGIFQYEGRAVRSISGALRPDNFREVCDITALARPGPLHNGSAQAYIDIKRGVVKPTVSHPALASITSGTYWQIIYQEQILRIVREIGNFDWTHAAHIRRIISKKLGDQEFQRQWHRFWEGAQTVHERYDVPEMSEDVARAIWGDCITAGSYAFNAAHTVSYGYIAWWDGHFKVHHQGIWYKWLLRGAKKKKASAGGNAKASAVSKAEIPVETIFLRDALRHGHKIEPPSFAQTDLTWTYAKDTKTLHGGLLQIPGIGESKAKDLIAGRDEQGLTEWGEIERIKGFGPVTAGAVQDWVGQPDPFGIYTLDNMIQKVKTELPKLGLPEPTHTAQEVPYERGRDTEVTWMGVIVSRNLRDIFEINKARGVEVDPEQMDRPDLNEWMIAAGYDGTEIVSIRIDRYKYPGFRKALWGLRLNKDVVVVHGVKPGFRAAREIKAKKMWVVDPDA
jgi:DNA polymerase III subunit alpha